MTSSALLDTSALISAVDGRYVAGLPYDQLFVSALSHAELRLGLVTPTDTSVLRQRMRRIDEIERTFGNGLPFDDACAREYERIVQAAVEHGQQPRSNALDRMIAAIAVANDMPLITRNPSDLRGLGSIVEVVAL